MASGFLRLADNRSPTTSARTESPALFRVSIYVAAVPRDTVMTEQLRFQELNARAAAISRGGFEDSQAAADRMRQAAAEGRAPQPPTANGYVPVYYPGTTAPSEAQRVQVGLGQQVLGVDMRLDVMQTATVTGIVDRSGWPAWRGAGATHHSGRSELAGGRLVSRTRVLRAGFLSRGLCRGSYMVRARRDDGRRAAAAGRLADRIGRCARQRGRDQQRRGQPAGRCAGRRQSRACGDPRALRSHARAREPCHLFLPRPMRETGTSARRRQTRRAGSFVRGVMPARYRLEVAGLPSGWHLASAIFDGRDAADHHLVVEHDTRYDGALTFTSTTSELSGGLVRGLGAPAVSQTVVLFPVGP